MSSRYISLFWRLGVRSSPSVYRVYCLAANTLSADLEHSSRLELSPACASHANNQIGHG